MTQHTQLHCACGRVQLDLTATPIISAECHCHSCRTAAATLQTLPNAQPILEANGGTGFVLYRKDRVHISAGAELLKEHRLNELTQTRRVLATCCNTPIFLEFQRGHWLSLYSRLWPEASRPAIECRTMLMDRKDAPALTDDVPNARRQPLSFFAKLLGAWVAMGFRVPNVAVAGGTLHV